MRPPKVSALLLPTQTHQEAGQERPANSCKCSRKKWLQSLANLREGLISCTQLSQACLYPQPLPLCRHHQRIPSLLNPQHSKLSPAGWRLNSIKALICFPPPFPLRLRLKWQQSRGSHTQPQGWGCPDITEGCCVCQACCWERGVPSGLHTLTAPGHHQHTFTAPRNHPPGRVNGDLERAAPGIRNKLRHKTEALVKWLLWGEQNTELTGRTNSLGLETFPTLPTQHRSGRDT